MAKRRTGGIEIRNANAVVPPAEDTAWMRRALQLARRGYGCTAPNPMVGAVLVRNGSVLGEGWHRKAGLPHAEPEAFAAAARRGLNPAGATLYVTLEPCCTHGRTPPCTEKIIASRVARVVVGAIDPNPAHSGRGLALLRDAGIAVTEGVLSDAATELNEGFNHWIRFRTPFVTVKAAMTLDGKIATSSGESKWITGEASRREGMKLRLGSDAILVGVNTILRDDPSLTLRGPAAVRRCNRPLVRIVLDSRARIPTTARVLTDDQADHTVVIVTARAARRRVEALRRRVRVLESPTSAEGQVNLLWLMRALGSEGITSLLVEGGGEVNASFLEAGLVHRVALFYAPLVLGGSDAIKAVAGKGASTEGEILNLCRMRWKRLGPDLCLTARRAPEVGRR